MFSPHDRPNAPWTRGVNGGMNRKTKHTVAETKFAYFILEWRVNVFRLTGQVCGTTDLPRLSARFNSLPQFLHKIRVRYAGHIVKYEGYDK